MIALPDDGLSKPVSMYMAVVFPAPLCPNIVKISFSLMETVRFFTAVKSPNFFVKFCIKILSFLL